MRNQEQRDAVAQDWARLKEEIGDGPIQVDLHQNACGCAATPCEHVVQVLVTLPTPVEIMRVADRVTNEAQGLDRPPRQEDARLLGLGWDGGTAWQPWWANQDRAADEARWMINGLNSMLWRLSLMRDARLRKGWRADQAMRQLGNVCYITDSRLRAQAALKRQLKREGPEEVPL